jgi:hypothetical protein
MKAQALLRVAKTGPADAELCAALVAAAQTISSDYERGRVLSVLFDKKNHD